VIGVYFYGQSPYGAVDRVDGTAVVTTFGHFWFLPLVPLGSYVRGSGAGGVPLAIAIGFHLRSVIAGYLRTWCAVLLVLIALGAAAGWREFLVADVPLWVDALVLAAALVAAWSVLGRLSPSAQAQRRIYGKFAGLPVDVAWLSSAQASDLGERLASVLTEEGRALTATYRDGPDPCDAWREVALSPAVDHRPYLEAALTRARLELPRARGPQARALRDAHARIWRKLAA
jgi:hypothetical protein